MQRLNHEVNQTAAMRSLRYAGRSEEIMVEGTNLKNPHQLMGRTRTNRIAFNANTTDKSLDELLGQTLAIKIAEVRPFSLTGVIQCSKHQLKTCMNLTFYYGLKTL